MASAPNHTIAPSRVPSAKDRVTATRRWTGSRTLRWMIAGPTPIWETIWEQAITTVAAPIRPNSAGVSRRPSAMMVRNWTTTWTPVPEKVQTMPPIARRVSPGGAPAPLALRGVKGG